MNVVITPKVLQAYFLCSCKAYLLMYGQEQGKPHEYEQILTRNQLANQAIQEDNLSRLDRMTPKSIRQYERKEIFTADYIQI